MQSVEGGKSFFKTKEAFPQQLFAQWIKLGI